MIPPPPEPSAPPAKRQAIISADDDATMTFHSRPQNIDGDEVDEPQFPSRPTTDDILRALPAHLSERIRVLKPSRPSAAAATTTSSARTPGAVDAPEKFVLYWMRNAMRATENPSLCVAAAAANAMNLSLIHI